MELRIPIFDGPRRHRLLRRGAGLGGLLPDPSSFEGDNGLRQGVGFGLRYMTPIGPMRVEYGWPVSARTITYNATATVTVPDPNDPTKTKSITTLDCSGKPCTATTRESGRFFVSIGYPF